MIVLEAIYVVLALVGMVLVIRKQRVGWMVWTVANMMAMVVFMSRHLYPTVGLFMVFTVLNVVAYIKWREKK